MASLVPNPFVKKRNLEWSISPPKRQKRGPEPSASTEASLASIFPVLDPFPPTPRISVEAVQNLYEAAVARHQGAHFVVHQHDHPVAGPHYDLRLQINPTSSASWAVMYGLPGDPGSSRPGRTAAETRVHCLESHLAESASPASGSLLIWDTGTYQVLEPGDTSPETEGEGGSGSEREGSEPVSAEPGLLEQEKLQAAFASRKIRLRLNGARLPRGYTVNLRLTAAADRKGRAQASRPTRQKRRGPKPVETPSDSSEDGAPNELQDTELQEEAQVRRTNAYAGASNTIGSVHQRLWFLSLDKAGSGLTRRRIDGKVKWEWDSATPASPKDPRLGFPFYVRGPEYERSVVTGRLGSDVVRDEGVTFVPRKGWRPVLN